MNTLYIRAAGLSLSLLALLPISATVPNGNDVLSTINGSPAVTVNELKEKMKEIVARTQSEKKNESFGNITKETFAGAVFNLLMIAKSTQLYVNDHKLNPTSLSKTMADGAEIFVNKHLFLSMTPEEKASLQQCILVAMHAVERLKANEQIAKAAQAVTEQELNRAYQQISQQAAHYNLSTVPPLKEVKPYLKLVGALANNPQLTQQLQLEWAVFVIQMNEKHKISYNIEAFKQFAKDHCQGKVL